MHEVQDKLLRLSKTQDISKMGLRRLARLLDIKNPQTVKYHLGKLVEQGLIKYSGSSGIATKGIPETKSFTTKLVDIPVYGEANCGQATILAIESDKGFLRVSPRILVKTRDIFAIRACGDSMNSARNVTGGTIDDGDYVIVDSKTIVPRPGDYVLSIINGCANIKRFGIDVSGNVVLFSESTEDYPPIYIHPEEAEDYMVNGKVIQVIKKPKVN